MVGYCSPLDRAGNELCPLQRQAKTSSQKQVGRRAIDLNIDRGYQDNLSNHLKVLLSKDKGIERIRKETLQVCVQELNESELSKRC